MSKISIYQLLPRLFGNKNTKLVPHGSSAQNGVGKLNDISLHALQEIKNLGITHIWYTGIIEHARCEGNPEYNIPAGHPAVIKGRAGSPYAISDYYDINPDLAENVPIRVNEFQELVQRTHQLKLKVIIDFVPNHVGRQYHSDIFPERDFGRNDSTGKAFSPENDFYYIPNEELKVNPGMGTILPTDNVPPYYEFPAKVTGNNKFTSQPDINDWYETVKLNYGIDFQNGHTKQFDPVPPVWNKMVDILLYWCSKEVDGFRCDMVEMVPVEFWAFAIPKVKKQYPEVIFIAEVYQPALYEQYIFKGQFDYLYDKSGLYDTLREVITGKASASKITQCWQNSEGVEKHLLKFLENHDEQRIASRFFAGDPWHALPGVLLCATMNTSPVMTYFGQEVGEPAVGSSGFSGDDGRTTIFDYWNIPELQKWMNQGCFNEDLLDEKQVELRNQYKKILQLAITSPAVKKGSFYDLMWANNHPGGPDSQYIFAYLRFCDEEKLVLVTNFNKEINQKFALKIPGDALNKMGIKTDTIYNFVPVYGQGTSFNASGGQISNMGIWVDLAPHSSLVLGINEQEVN